MKRVFVTLALSLSLMSCGVLNNQGTCTGSCNEVKNVIFMIGDGMGLAQASMLMIENGYDGKTAFDRSDNVALIKTYSANNRVTDSAAAGTALATGFKTRNAMLGLTPQLDTCYSLAVKAQDVGMATGVVVSCELQHATPAAFYAHVKSRGDNFNITRQLAASKFDVAIGGGLKHFSGEVDGKSFLDTAKDNGYNVVLSAEELSSLGEGRVLGLYEQGHIKSILNGRGDYLPKATEMALERLSKNDKGFFLMVEGSQIDWACHKNDQEGTLTEVADFNDCLNVVMDFADRNPGTLVVITADHETGALSMVSGDADFSKGESGIDYKYSTSGHSGILVPVYTYGCGAHLISGVMENTELSRKIGEILGL